MSKKKTKKSDFANVLQSLLEQEQERLQKMLDKKERREQAIRDAQKRYLKWRKDQRSECEKAAKIILDWVRDFVSSERFEQLAKLRRLKERTRDKWNVSCSISPDEDLNIIISRIIRYKHPSYRGIPEIETDTSTWILLINMQSKKLVVLNAVKYGKSYEVETVDELLQYTDPPVVLEVARTIKEGEIEDIILEILQQYGSKQ